MILDAWPIVVTEDLRGVTEEVTEQETEQKCRCPRTALVKEYEHPAAIGSSSDPIEIGSDSEEEEDIVIVPLHCEVCGMRNF